MCTHLYEYEVNNYYIIILNANYWAVDLIFRVNTNKLAIIIFLVHYTIIRVYCVY